MKKNPFVYYGKKLLIFIISVVFLSLAVFYISRLAPGDPLMSYYGERVEKMSPAEKDAAREKLGLNDPIHIQYIRWAQNALKGDFGISFKYKHAECYQGHWPADQQYADSRRHRFCSDLRGRVGTGDSVRMVRR